MNKVLKFGEFLNEGKKFTTLDNGGMPFAVDVDRMVTIFKNTHRYEIKETFDGYADGKGDKDSCMLFRISENQYLFVGSEIYEFETTEKITEFYGSIGNSAVPYPVAVSENLAFFMLDKVSVEKNKFNEDTDWSNAYTQFYKIKEDLELIEFDNFKQIETNILTECKIESINEGRNDVTRNIGGSKVTFAMSIQASRNGIYLNVLPKTTKDIDKLTKADSTGLPDDTQPIELIQKLILDRTFGEGAFAPDLSHPGAGYWYTVTDDLLDDVIIKHLKH